MVGGGREYATTHASGDGVPLMTSTEHCMSRGVQHIEGSVTAGTGIVLSQRDAS